MFRFRNTRNETFRNVSGPNFRFFETFRNVSEPIFLFFETFLPILPLQNPDSETCAAPAAGYPGKWVLGAAEKSGNFSSDFFRFFFSSRKKSSKKILTYIDPKFSQRFRKSHLENPPISAKVRKIQKPNCS